MAINTEIVTANAGVEPTLVPSAVKTPHGGQDVESFALHVPLWLLWIAAFVFVGVGLGSYAIMDNNEGLYAEIPREMLRSGDWTQWIIPHLNGLVYMEKPPLLYWLTGLSFAIFGESEWSARLVPALSGLACVGLMVWFGRRIGRTQAARLAALMFISGLGVMIMSRTLMFDMLLTAMLTGALTCGYLFMTEGDRKAQRWSMVFLALGVLSKGFVALILFCIVVGTYTLASSSSFPDLWRRIRRWLNPVALALFMLIAAPWHLIAIGVEPIFAWFYFINEHVLRFLGKREPHDYYAGAWWYYLPRMMIYLFPWSFFLPVLVFAKPLAKFQRRLNIFLCLAWLMPVLFFSVSSAKANYYLVAVMPFAALQLSILLQDRDFGGRVGRIVPGVLLAVLLMILALFVSRQNQAALKGAIVLGVSGTHFLGIAFGVMGLLALLASFVAWRFPRMGLLPFLGVPLLALFSFLSVMHASAAWTSTRPLAAILQHDYPDRQVFLFRIFEEQSSLPFYLKQSVPIVESRSNDLFWGIKLYRNNISWTGVDFQRYATSNPTALIVLDQDMQDFMGKNYYKYFHIAQKNGKATLFLN